MYPIIFNYKFITIGSYGLMLGITFYCCFLFVEKEFIRIGLNSEFAYKIMLTVIPSAIIGAKLFHILENLTDFFKNPIGMIFSGAGLTVYGGVVFTILMLLIVIKKNKQDILYILDILTPILAFGYGLGRFSCHLAGDGCFGIKTDSFLGVSYPNGIVPSTDMVFPTPLFESFVSLLICVFLLYYRKREFQQGMIFFTYLILNGISRFLVEFVRVNPKGMLGLSSAQFVGIMFILTGIMGIVLVQKKKRFSL
ncbi:prolipoprotein diacylglyceryl transferase [Spirochaetota bacterium]